MYVWWNPIKENYPPTLELLLALPHDLSRRVPQREGQQCPVSTTHSPEKCLQMWKSHGIFPFGTKMYKWCFYSTSMFTGGQWEFITWMSVSTVSACRDPSCWLACLSTSNGPTMAQNHVYPPTLRRKNSSDLATHISWLVVLTILVNGKDHPWLSHILWKIKFMFETTNHYHIYIYIRMIYVFHIYLVVQCK